MVSRAFEQRQSRRRAGDGASVRRPPAVKAADEARQDEDAAERLREGFVRVVARGKAE